MSLNYIIVQAGGKGTRMESLTANKPKALVPIDNLPIIYLESIQVKNLLLLVIINMMFWIDI